MTGAQARMARAALKLSVRDVASAAKVSPNTVTRIEADMPSNNSTIAAVRTALESAGVIFVEENGDGPGVRLRKHEAGRVHALEKAEEAADRQLAQVDASAQVKAKRKRIVTKLAKDLATGVTRK